MFRVEKKETLADVVLEILYTEDKTGKERIPLKKDKLERVEAGNVLVVPFSLYLRYNKYR